MSRLRIQPAQAFLALLLAGVVGACGTGGPTVTTIQTTLTAATSGPAATSVAPSAPHATSVAPSAPHAPSAAPSAPEADLSSWIVYEHDGLRLVHADGSNDHPLSIDGVTNAQHPDWSPDGSRLAFVVDDEEGTRDIWTAGIDGSDARALFDCRLPCVDADGPAWSPDGNSIAFRTFDYIDEAYPGSALLVYDLGTGVATTIVETEAPDYIGNGTPVRWSPDGSSLVMDVSTIEGPGTDAELVTRSAIAVVDLSSPSRAVTEVTTTPTFPSYADWNPAGDLIVFMAVSGALSGEPLNLFTMEPDGQNLKQITNFDSDHDVWGPTWSPDGSSISVTVLDPEWELGSVSPDGSTLELVPGPILGAHGRMQPTR